jgi:3-oxoacyl-[acyl-carrier protein] reductase
LWGSLAVIRQSVPVMIEGGGGAIVVISSIAGLEALGAPAPYAAAKSALNAACKSLSKDLARHNIRVNIVAPGNVFFLGGTWDKKQQENPAAVRHYLETHVPMQRLGEPREIANIVAFVASPRASFMTGSCVVVDGGQTRAL